MALSTPDVSPDHEMESSDEAEILTAFAVLSLTAGTASVARAYTTGFVNNAYQSGQYDNFSYGPGDIGVGH